MSRRVLFMLSGSIASYKACHVISRLKQAGHELEIVASPWALRFVGEATFEGLTGKPVHKSMFGTGAHMSHINLVRWAELVIVCPATANTINKLANGVGDDLITTLFLAHDFSKPWLIAPAMNTKMYHHPATRTSVDKLRSMGCRILETASGVLACGEIGDGKLLDQDLLLKAVVDELAKLPARSAAAPATTSRIGNSRRILITSGGTEEPIDAVRSITNFSTGRTGAALAEVFAGLGHRVHYLAATSAATPKLDDLESPTVHIDHFRTFGDLESKLRSALSTDEFDMVIHAAAVSDYSIENGAADSKIDSADGLVLKLKRNPKLLDCIRDWSKKKDVKVVAFKLTASKDAAARSNKVGALAARGVADFVVANDFHSLPKWELHRTSGATSSNEKSGDDRHELGFALEALL